MLIRRIQNTLPFRISKPVTGKNSEPELLKACGKEKHLGMFAIILALGRQRQVNLLIQYRPAWSIEQIPVQSRLQ